MMMKQLVLILVITSTSVIVNAQFHTLKMPQASPHVKETQTLGVTDITIDYSSPSVKGRKVFETVVPKNSEPIPWRAGANMNTTIDFSTDVMINGKNLKAGIYGFHVIPTDNNWILIFAHAWNQWGSYYLNRDEDVALEINSSPTENTFSEQLNYTFENRTDSTMVIALEWESKRIPFEVEVDLNETVITSFRSELRGINTYHWQAWADAARWCLNRNANLEEALTWVNRSIEGGYGGFAADKNMTNMALKSDLLFALGKKGEAKSVMSEALGLAKNVDEMYGAGMSLLRNGRKEESLTVFEKCTKEFPEVWYPYLGHARALSATGEFKKAFKAIDSALNRLPDDNYRDYLKSQKEQLAKKQKI